MSNQRSTCVPPPSSYAPKPRPPHGVNFRDRTAGGTRGRHRDKRGLHSGDVSFQKNQTPDVEARLRNQPKDKFHRNDDDDYFGHIQEDEDPKAEANRRTSSEDEDDPLDAYMKSLGSTEKTSDEHHETNEESRTEALSEETKFDSNPKETDKRGVRLDIDSVDDLEESYYNFVKQTKKKQSNNPDIDESNDQLDLVEYDSQGNPIGVRKLKKEIEPLQLVDHSTISYESFERNFYQEHDEISKLSKEQSDELRTKLDIRVYGNSPPKPVCSFAHFKFDEQLMNIIRKSEYTQPTPIQAQAIPAVLSGRNVIGIAITGSGKTAAYLWPMIMHIKNQPTIKKGEGPIALILVPTRELALQVYGEARKISRSYRMSVVCAYGGGSKYLQSEDLKAGAEIVVATPGRLIDLVKMGATTLKRVTYLVLDEADRFFDMGFEAQVRSICSGVRPDRQTLLFSATFKKRIEELALTVTENPVKIVQKALGDANEDVTQHVIVLGEDPDKWNWLTKRLVEFTSAGSVLIFVTRITNCEQLFNDLKEANKETLLLHGDMEQSERNRVITSFRRKEKEIMIATDVASRGLDISHIRTVINYDVARDIDTHTHRIGRTGRAGVKGDAYTLITGKDKDFAGHLVKNLESSSQIVSDELLRLAMQSYTFRKSRSSKGSHQGSSGSYDKGRGYNSGDRDRGIKRSYDSDRSDHRDSNRSYNRRTSSSHHHKDYHDSDRKYRRH